MGAYGDELYESLTPANGEVVVASLAYSFPTPTGAFTTKLKSQTCQQTIARI